MENILHLSIQKKWFDMILVGFKKEEYREIKPYWAARLVKNVAYHWQSEFMADHFGTTTGSVTYEGRHYDIARFHNGYSLLCPTVDVKILNITVGTGLPEWGAVKAQPYFVIKLGKVIQKYNV